MHLIRLAIAAAVVLGAVPGLRAEYIVLSSGQRLHVTGYQLLADKYKLQVQGGSLEIPATEVVGIEPEDVFTPATPTPLPNTSDKGPFAELIQAAAKHYSLDADLISSVIAAESNFNPKAISPRDARGLMQLLPVTAARLGVQNIFDPRENIEAGTHYLSDLLKLYKNDIALALAAYNAGPDAVQKFGRVPPYAETVSYVRRVKKTFDHRKSNSTPAPATETGSASASTTAPTNK
jgi:Transglycosylase SLT domain